MSCLSNDFHIVLVVLAVITVIIVGVSTLSSLRTRVLLLEEESRDNMVCECNDTSR